MEESENEQRQEVISRRDQPKKANQASLLSVENSQNSGSKKNIDVKDRWMKVRDTMDFEASGDVMLEGMLPRVRVDRKTSPKRFVAANGEQIRD